MFTSSESAVTNRLLKHPACVRADTYDRTRVATGTTPSSRTLNFLRVSRTAEQINRSENEPLNFIDILILCICVRVCVFCFSTPEEAFVAVSQIAAGAANPAPISGLNGTKEGDGEAKKKLRRWKIRAYPSLPCTT